MVPDWQLISAVFTFLILLSILIIAHEYGHFWVARKCGIKVERFGFGLPFGPTLWSKKIGDVEYCIHALLLGGYVSFPDDNPDSNVPQDSPGRFENQPLWNRFAVAIAGVTVNAILGWAIMVFVFMYWGEPVPNRNITIGDNFVKNGPAQLAGLKTGDIIQKINGEPLPNTSVIEERSQFVPTTMKKYAGKTIPLEILRDKKTMTLPVSVNKEGRIGIEIGPGASYQPVTNPLRAGQLSATFLSTFIVKNFEAIGQMFTGQISTKQLSGPIEIITVGSQTIAKHGMQQGLMLTAVISTILAVMNILPIPALDGGHILFILIEALKGSPVKREIQEQFTQLGFVGLMLLMCFVLWNDATKQYERFFPSPEKPAGQEAPQPAQP